MVFKDEPPEFFCRGLAALENGIEGLGFGAASGFAVGLVAVIAGADNPGAWLLYSTLAGAGGGAVIDGAYGAISENEKPIMNTWHRICDWYQSNRDTVVSVAKNVGRRVGAGALHAFEGAVIGALVCLGAGPGAEDAARYMNPEDANLVLKTLPYFMYGGAYFGGTLGGLYGVIMGDMEPLVKKCVRSADK